MSDNEEADHDVSFNRLLITPYAQDLLDILTPIKDTKLNWHRQPDGRVDHGILAIADVAREPGCLPRRIDWSASSVEYTNNSGCFALVVVTGEPRSVTYEAFEKP